MNIPDMDQLLGSVGRFYIADQAGRSRRYYSSFASALGELGQCAELDLCALTEVIPAHAFVGDKTLIRQIRRTEYLACYNPEQERYLPVNIPEYGVCVAPAEQIATELLAALRREIGGFVGNARRVGILLSGGMDSRIVASVLQQVQKDRPGLEVVAFTWGNPASRDPIYSRRIADLYNWGYEHFEITPEGLLENIQTCGQEGCFYPPNHLHAMVAVGRRARELSVDCILAGSYGDSIGRGEYEGVHVTRLRPYADKLNNRFQILNGGFYRRMRAHSLRAVDAQHRLYRAPAAAFNELDYQMHYMRNMLNTCMGVIVRDVPLYQVFTSYETVCTVLKYAGGCRTDGVYRCLLAAVDLRLLEIPWARTGRPYMDAAAQADAHPKSFHSYHAWAGGELYEPVRALAFSDSVTGLGVFNMEQLDWLIGQGRRSGVFNSRVLEAFLWLASLSVFLKSHRPAVPAAELPRAVRRPVVAGQLEYKIAAARRALRSKAG